MRRTGGLIHLSGVPHLHMHVNRPLKAATQRKAFTSGCLPSLKGAVSRNSAKLGNYKMPVKLLN